MTTQTAVGAPAAAANETLTVAALSATAVMMMTALLLPSPLLVELARSFEVTVAAAGQLTTVAALPWGVGAVIMGPLSDRFGRRRVLLAGVALQCVTTLGCALAWDFTSLMALRFLAGVGGGCVGPNILSIIGDVVPEHRKGQALGWVSLGFSLSTLLTLPAAAAIGGIGGWRLAFAVIGGVIALEVLLLRRLLPAHLSAPRAGQGALKGGVWAGYGAVVTRPRLVSLLMANIAERAVYAGLTVYLPAFLIQTYGMTTAQVAPVLPAIAVGALAGTLSGGWLADRTNPRLLFGAVQVLAGLACLVVYAAVPPLGLALLVSGLFGLANALGRPPYMLMVSRAAVVAPGAVFGIYAMMNQLGIVAGTALGGLAISAGGYPVLGGLVLVAGVLSCLLGAALSPKRSDESPP